MIWTQAKPLGALSRHSTCGLAAIRARFCMATGSASILVQTFLTGHSHCRKKEPGVVCESLLTRSTMAAQPTKRRPSKSLSETRSLHRNLWITFRQGQDSYVCELKCTPKGRSTFFMEPTQY